MLVKELVYIIIKEYVSREYHVMPASVIPEHILNFFKTLESERGARTRLFYKIFKIIFDCSRCNREQLSVFLTWLQKPQNVASVRNLINLHSFIVI